MRPVRPLPETPRTFQYRVRLRATIRARKGALALYRT